MTTASPAAGSPAAVVHGHAVAISVSDLVKTFGPTRALDGLDLTVATGEVHGFLGPNGAGKTTTIRVLLGLLRPDAGRARLLHGDPWHDTVALHRRLAYVPGDVSLWPKLTGGEIIDVFGRLRGDLDRVRRDELLERFELDPTKKARTYSKGNRQKVGLVAALASRAELLILDEPTSGLDPLMETVFQDCIREVKAEGRTVLLSSHILAEVEALCDRVNIIRAGRTALWVLAGLVTALFGLAPRAVTAAWAVLGLCLVAGILGDILDLPNWLLDLSPFQHLPQLPAHHPTATSPAVLTGIAAALTAVGLAAFRRRDVA